MENGKLIPVFEAIVNGLKELHNDRDVLQKKIDAMEAFIRDFPYDDQIADYVKEPRPNDQTNSKSQKLEPAEVVANFFKSESRFLHNREVALYLQKNYYKPGHDFEAIRKQARSSIDTLKKSGVLVRYTVGKSNNFTNSFWGSPNWLDENGDIKQGYEYDERYVVKNKLSLE